MAAWLMGLAATTALATTVAMEATAIPAPQWLSVAPATVFGLMLAHCGDRRAALWTAGAGGVA
ncbi:hypothetical protein SB781_40730, partial [Paraburkholderia sp. SIMBA_061]